LAGLLRVPDQSERFPAVLLVHWLSGAGQDGNLLEEGMEHQPLRRTSFWRLRKGFSARAMPPSPGPARLRESEGQLEGMCSPRPEMRELP